MMYCSVLGCDPGFPLISLELLDSIVILSSSFSGGKTVTQFLFYTMAGNTVVVVTTISVIGCWSGDAQLLQGLT